MNGLRHSEADKGLLRWGGLAGILGSALLLFVFIFVGAVVGPDPAGATGPVARFPEIRAARTLENSLYLAVIALWALHVVALCRALSITSLASALFGGVLGVVGLTILAAGALPHFVTSRLSDLYHAAGATPQDQAAVAVAWQANQGIFDALLAAGLLPLLLGLVALGVGMLRAPAFGRALGGATVALGLIGVGAAGVFVVDPRSPIVVVGFLALIVANLVTGWKLRRLSRASQVAPVRIADLMAAESSLPA